MEAALLGSTCPLAWLIVTVGGPAVNWTVLSVLVDAALGWLPASLAAPAGIEATTVPLVVMPLTATVYSGPVPETTATRVPPAVEPAKDTSDAVKPVTGLLNVTRKAIGPPLGGSG